MVARLTNTPMNKYPKSTTNSTYDNNDYVFPLNQPMYFDFTHDTVIAAGERNKTSCLEPC